MRCIQQSEPCSNPTECSTPLSQPCSRPHKHILLPCQALCSRSNHLIRRRDDVQRSPSNGHVRPWYHLWLAQYPRPVLSRCCSLMMPLQEDIYNNSTPGGTKNYPVFGYHPNNSKTWLVVKQENCRESLRWHWCSHNMHRQVSSRRRHWQAKFHWRVSPPEGCSLERRAWTPLSFHKSRTPCCILSIHPWPHWNVDICIEIHWRHWSSATAPWRHHLLAVLANTDWKRLGIWAPSTTFSS